MAEQIDLVSVLGEWIDAHGNQLSERNKQHLLDNLLEEIETNEGELDDWFDRIDEGMETLTASDVNEWLEKSGVFETRLNEWICYGIAEDAEEFMCEHGEYVHDAMHKLKWIDLNNRENSVDELVNELVYGKYEELYNYLTAAVKDYEKKILEYGEFRVPSYVISQRENGKKIMGKLEDIFRDAKTHEQTKETTKKPSVERG